MRRVKGEGGRVREIREESSKGEVGVVFKKFNRYVQRVEHQPTTQPLIVMIFIVMNH